MTYMGKVYTYVRNIPDINQMLTERKIWGKIAETPIQGTKFDKEFPHLLGKNKNKIEEKPDLSGRWTNLSSGQAPAATAQTPATPASIPAASQAPAAHLLACPAACPQPTRSLPGPQLAGCHPPTWAPGLTLQPIRNSPGVQPIKKIPENKGKFRSQNFPSRRTRK
ncbi:hypothetical protein DSO57_1029062 [Entomophthora muscae]|uniref:Uncharacterized protein n=1 Tax=Entomophthora muscae TaxID=34485 RepID=A0ACC2TZV1_9FUNG|nr:hypothetical protein DSO57_1029062 [Entomophthora muscae]